MRLTPAPPFCTLCSVRVPLRSNSRMGRGSTGGCRSKGTSGGCTCPTQLFMGGCILSGFILGGSILVGSLVYNLSAVPPALAADLNANFPPPAVSAFSLSTLLWSCRSVSSSRLRTDPVASTRQHWMCKLSLSSEDPL